MATAPWYTAATGSLTRKDEPWRGPALVALTVPP